MKIHRLKIIVQNRMVGTMRPFVQVDHRFLEGHETYHKEGRCAQ